MKTHEHQGMPPRIAAMHGMVGAVTSLLPSETQEAMAAIADARAKGEPPILPTLPSMNMTERAARAEALAARLADELANLAGQIGPGTMTRSSYAALDAWSQHRADLDTLRMA